MEKALIKYYQSLSQEIRATQLSDENGGSSEQIFTQIAINNLSDAGETENALLAFDKKGVGTRNQHQINGYGFSDNYETLDLFITVYKGTESISTTSKSDVETAQKRISNFFQKCIKIDFVNEIEESSEIFQLASSIARYEEIKENLSRVNVIILTDGEYKGDFPKSDSIGNYSIFYRVVDIHFLYKISDDNRVPVEIDFRDFYGEKFEIPCLSVTDSGTKYRTYIAIISGLCLARLYERYGARLLEQNVRSFLQVGNRNSVNDKIRRTIRDESDMFLAYNNGIAATADYIVLDETGRFLTKVNNLQIVNGGQTTASIYNAFVKDKLDISRISVQAKFTVIENQGDYGKIVSKISEYSNTQNKVNNADFSATNPILVEIERLSRYVLTPITSSSNIQTSWFFERARGQYKTLRNREGRTKSTEAAFDRKFPKNQMFTKVELAKFINSYKEVYEGDKLVIGPHIVVRGNEKNYSQFMDISRNSLLEKIKNEGNVYFEDTIAKAILFKNADKRYGVKPNSIGELKQVVVPYTLSLLNIITKDNLDLYKIWNNQSVSSELSDFIFDLMKQVNAFIVKTYNGQHYIEKAKKEECWERVKKHTWKYDINLIINDIKDINSTSNRVIKGDFDEEELKQNTEIVKSVPPFLWNEILDWGIASELFDITKQTIVSNIAQKLKQKRVIAPDEYKKAVEILNFVARYNEELLQKTEELTKVKEFTPKKIKPTDDQKNALILGLIEKMLAFNSDLHILSVKQVDFMYDVLNGRIENGFEAQMELAKLLRVLEKRGFKVGL